MADISLDSIGAPPPREKVTEDLDRTVDAVSGLVLATKRGGADEINAAATEIQAVTNNLTQAIILPVAMAEPELQPQLIGFMTAIAGHITALVAAFQMSSKEPGNKLVLMQFENTAKTVCDSVVELAGILSISYSRADGADGVAAAEPIMSSATQQKLIETNKEAAQTALQLADLASHAVADIQDPAKKAQLEKAIADARAAAARVQANPADHAAQQALTVAVQNLLDTVRQVADVKDIDQLMEAINTMTQESVAGNAQVGQMQAGSASLQMAPAAQGSPQSVINSAIAASDRLKGFTDPSSAPAMSAADRIKASKELSSEVAQLAKQVSQMAAGISDPKYKKQLENYAKLLRDRALQLKIITSVKAAGSDDDPAKNTEVQAAAKLLNETILEVQDQVKSIALMKRLQSAVTQVMAMKKAVNAFKGLKAKK